MKIGGALAFCSGRILEAVVLTLQYRELQSVVLETDFGKPNNG